jgi:tRNA(Arg) A34 adenosine deaminase TadA
MAKKPEEKFMKRAIELARHGSLEEKSGGVFGAVIVKDGVIVGEGYNQVVKQKDPTWHGEMHAIRQACQNLGTIHLDGCVMYTTGQCCPMCLAAAYWAHLDHIFYGATFEDALTYGHFNDLDIEDQIRQDPKNRRIEATEFLRPQVIEVWKEFQKMADPIHY